MFSCWLWSCASNVFGMSRGERPTWMFSRAVSWSVGCRSSRSKNYWLFPVSCKAVNSGGSRKRSVLVPLTDRKLPIVWDPPPRLPSNVGLLKDPYPSDSEPVGVDWSSPDLVTMWTIRLLLSPYSAGGTPVMSSIACTALDELLLE